MGFSQNLLRHPRRLWLRRALFQVHLWVGLALALYLIVIALSGSVLVFRDELTRRSLPSDLRVASAHQGASPVEVLARFAQAEPHGRLTELQLPSPVLPVFLLGGTDSAGHAAHWLADPATGSIHPQPRTWLDWLYDLHLYLLLPKSWGIQANAVGAGALLLLALSGLGLWWQGLRLWTRGLRLNLRAHWRRFNYDLHHVIGFWTLPLVLWWAFSGVYFGFYRQVAATLSVVSPMRGMTSPEPAALPPAPASSVASLPALLASAHNASPTGRLWSISLPADPTGDSYAELDRAAPGDFSHRDIVRLRAADARILSVWHYGENHTATDWILWSMHPLHFGTLWGTAIKAVWSLLGASLAVLSATGVLMYWNRYLRHLF